MDPPTERTSVRVILLDAADRVLLLGARDPDDGRTVWFMPGGGVEPGESFTETADRELREELGVSGLAVAGPVWTRDHDHTWDGRAIRQTEWFLLARTSRTLPAERIRPPAPEGDYFVGARWLGVEDVRRSADLIAPRRLAELLPPLLAGVHPRRSRRASSCALTGVVEGEKKAPHYEMGSELIATLVSARRERCQQETNRHRATDDDGQTQPPHHLV